MKHQTHLLKREAIYYLRRKVPGDLQDYFGKTEIRISLKTKDCNEACRLVRKKSAELDREFERIRGLIAKKSPETTSIVDDSMIESICDAWRHCALDGDEWYRQQGLTESESEDLTADRRDTDAYLRKLLARGQVEEIYPAPHQFMYFMGIDLTLG